MKTTYTGTLFHRDLTTAKVELYITKSNKYDCKDEYTGEPEKVFLPPIKSWSVVEGGPEADVIETIINEVDENREYLIINFADGKTEIYRNSHVTMFIF